jgi:hypothetical protein
MKNKVTVLLTCLLLSSLTWAQQQLVNAGFESWDTIADYTQPSGWYSLNSLAEFGFEQGTKLTADAHSGNYAVILESKSNPFGDMVGLLSSGPLMNDQFEPDLSKIKIPFSGSPSAVRFYYKSFPQPGDSCVFSMVLTRWNSSNGTTDTVGRARISLGSIVSSYTLADVAVEYASSLPPDSAFVIFSSSENSFSPIAGSIFQVDDIQLVYQPVGLPEQGMLDARIYPNPARGLITVELPGNTNATLELYDQAGRLVHRTITGSHSQVVDVSHFDAGIYYMMLRTEAGATGRFKTIIQD